MLVIRSQAPEDAAEVRRVNELAFGQPLEANLVERLQQACPDARSFVAADDGIVGHILFTPVVLEADGRTIGGMGLAPMAVRPDRQREGIGSRLVRHGLDLLRRGRCPFVIVVGHPAYYPRFGFARASMHGLTCQWEGIPDEAFMALILDPQAMAGASGVVRYRPEFDEVA